jgi:hypothetical protein
MADVLVRHCSIRVVRRGGWSWGPQPRALLDHILREVPALIAAELDKLFPDDEPEAEIAAPVRIAIPLSLAMLTIDSTSETMRALPRANGSLAAHLTKAFREALASGPHPDGLSPPERDESAPSSSITISGTTPSPAGEANPLSVLLGWARGEHLQERLRRFSPAALRAWHEWIVNDQSSAPHADYVPIESNPCSRALPHNGPKPPSMKRNGGSDA